MTRTVMKLNHKQKKYLKKNIGKKPLLEISADIKIPQEEIKNYLQKIWDKKKYENFWAKQEKNTIIKIFGKNLSFKNWVNKNRWHILLLVALVLVTYANSVNNAFLSDDIAGIVNNPSIGNIKSIFSNPFAFFHVFIYYATNRILGSSPAAFRIVNIFFHLGTALSLYFLLSLLFPPTVGFITALLFSVHPLLCESVVWISAGYNAYSAFWVLTSFSFYILSGQRKNKSQYWLSIFFYFIALGSSEKVIAFPIILFLYQIITKKIRKEWLRLIPFFILSFIWGIYLLGAFGSRAASLQQNFYQPISEVSTPGQFITATFQQTVVAASSYLSLIFWPKNLTLYHSEMNFTKIEYVAMVFIFLLYLGSIIYFYFRDKRVSFWLAFFIIILSPTLTPYGISWIVAERYAYLASIGIFTTIAYGLDKLRKTKKREVFVSLILGLIIIALSTRTIIRNVDWKDQDHLWLATAKTSPSSPQNHNNLGDLYYRQNQPQKAIEEFKKAIALKPDYADVYHNLANVYYLQMNDSDEAIKNYQKAAEINPKLWQSYQNLGKIYFDRQEYPAAEMALKKSLEINSQNLTLYSNLALLYLRTNKQDEAKKILQEALSIDPKNQEIIQLFNQLNSANP